MVPFRFLPLGAALLVVCACQAPRPLPPPSSQEAGQRAAAGLPEAARSAYLEGFKNGAAMVQVALRDGRKPFLLRAGARPEPVRPRAMGGLPDGASVVEAAPVAEVDPATGLQMLGLTEGPASPFDRGQCAGFDWGRTTYAKDLADRHLTRPRTLPNPPTTWTPWEDPEDRVSVEGGGLSGEITWFPGALAWQTGGHGFPPERHWRPAPAWLRPLHVALQADALWVETRGMGAVALDLETGAILTTLPAQAHPAREGYASYAALVADERKKLQEPAAQARLADLRKQALAGLPEAQYQLGRAVVPSDLEPDSAAPRVLWYLEAARRGHAKAMLELSAIYTAGLGVPMDEKEGRRWLEKAAAAGSPDAKFVLEGLASGLAKE